MFGVGATTTTQHSPSASQSLPAPLHLPQCPVSQHPARRSYSLIPPQKPVPAVEKEPVSPAELGSNPEPEPNIMSDQVCESATMPVAEGVLMVFEGMNGCPTHTPAIACKVNMDYGDFLEEDLIDWFTEAMTENSPISLTIPSPNIPVSPVLPVSPTPPLSVF